MTTNAVEDIAQRVRNLTAFERAQLLRMLSAEDAAIYRASPPLEGEFATDEEPLAWDADGWEDIR